jgi:hypothetical protein
VDALRESGSLLREPAFIERRVEQVLESLEHAEAGQQGSVDADADAGVSAFDSMERCARNENAVRGIPHRQTAAPPCVFEVRAELGDGSGDMGRERWSGLAHKCLITWPVSAVVTDIRDLNFPGGDRLPGDLSPREH